MFSGNILKIYGSDIYRDLIEIKNRRPLIHHIMNYVVMNDAANVTLAIGASPIMAHAIEEVEELVAVADAIYINIGTLDSHWIPSMVALAKAASRNKKPLILDPVGAGATRLRTETTIRILREAEVTILKGNGGEIAAIAGSRDLVKGVDSLGEANVDIVEKVAMEFNTTVFASGPVDVISDGSRYAEIRGGSELSRYVTGMGCMLGSIVSAFAAVNKDPLRASIDGSVFFKRAAELASRRAREPGSFRVELINAIYYISLDHLRDVEVEIRSRRSSQ
jgi:hydroxyethylthiazole kinase